MGPKDLYTLARCVERNQRRSLYPSCVKTTYKKLKKLIAVAEVMIWLIVSLALKQKSSAWNDNSELLSYIYTIGNEN